MTKWLMKARRIKVTIIPMGHSMVRIRTASYTQLKMVKYALLILILVPVALFVILQVRKSIIITVLGGNNQSLA